MVLDNKKIDRMSNFTYLGSIVSKDVECGEAVKSTITKMQVVFPQLTKNIRIIRK